MPDAELPPRHWAWIAEGIRRGDAAAEEAFVERYRRRLWVMMLARTRDPDVAAELVQDTLMAVIRALRGDAVRDVERLDAFVRGTARNLINNRLRLERRDPRPEPLDSEPVDWRALEQASFAERLAQVEAVLETFAPVDRTILKLTLVEGMHPREIAPRVGLNVELVRTRKSRALRTLVERIEVLSRK